ncbi:hypothetical protein [Bacillus thuringiensis]|uniref:hypothetical protein n=1 Tax=Bacillus thuringiensis TaxID=1428 RepID=UPI000BF3206B|nr:hypothetical protein [Bacillus thuringiensis]PEQ30014.1 hypothetical protein CN471_24795 [Bacillus thuringiensis]
MSTLMDLTVVSNTFVPMENDTIRRDNLIELLESILEKENVVILDGDDGSGKSVALRQFCQNHYDDAISLFINPSSKFGYDPNYIKMDICNQINWIVNKKELKDAELEDADIGSLIFKLQRFARIQKKIFYFIIDGIDDIPKGEEYIMELILTKLIPIGLPDFKVLISSNGSNLVQELLSNKGIIFREQTIMGFTTEETMKFFYNVTVDEEDAAEIRKACKGKPGYLASLRRILETGIEIKEVLNNLPEKMPNMFQYEWNQIDFNNEILISALCILAFDRKKHSIVTLSEYINTDTLELENLLKNVSFIEMKDNEIRYESEGFRKYVVSKLSHKKNQTMDLIIEYLLKLQSMDEKLTYLPGYLEESGRYEELLELLTAENFSTVLSKTESLGPLKKMIEWGAIASKALDKSTDIFKFGIQNSIIHENEKSTVWDSEIQALIALNEFDKAIALSQSNQLMEDRLHMLAIIARSKKEQGLTPEQEIIDQINNLYQKIDVNNLGERAIEIASDLVYTNTELAIELVEKAIGVGKRENALDIAFATLSLTALNKSKNQEGFESIKNLQEKIKNPKIRSFFDDFYIYIKGIDSDDILSDVKKLESVTDQINILANWTATNKKLKGSNQVIKYALNLIVNNPGYAPNAGIYKKLSSQLPLISEIEEIKEIVNLFEIQIENIERGGPRADYIELQLNIIKATNKFDKNAVCSKIIDLYLYISEVEDLTLRAEGLASVYSGLKDIDPKKEFEKTDQLHTLVENDLEEAVNKILDGSGAHYDQTKGIIKALTNSNPEKVLEVIKKMNTQDNRENAYHECILVILESEKNLDQLDVLMVCLEGIKKKTDLFEDALIQIIEKVFEQKNSIDDNVLSNYMRIFNKICEITETDLRCKAYCLVHCLFNNNAKFSSFAEYSLKELQETWNNIDIGWRKVNIGFKIVNTLAKHSIEKSREYLNLIEDYRKELNFFDPNISWSFIASIRLIIRVFSGLLVRKIDSKQDFYEITNLIEMVPSYGEKAVLWNELAIRFYQNGNSERAKQIVFEHVRPCIDKISDSDLRYKRHVIKKVSPTLYLAHRSTAFELFSQLPIGDRDLTYFTICEFILTKQSPHDPYDNRLSQGYPLTYEEIIDLCEIITKMKNDTIIHFYITEIVDSVESRQNKNKYTAQQKADIVSRITKIVEDQLPSQNDIQHDGYKIVSTAQMYRIKNVRINAWDELISQSEKIPNKADKLFTQTILASTLPKKNVEKINKLFIKIEEQIEELPTIMDQIGQYESMASLIVKNNSIKSKEYLKRAMELSLKTDDEAHVDTQRRIIDLAHRISPEFAESLVSLTDDDPARKLIRKELNEEFQTLELKKKMINGTPKQEINLPRDQYVTASWKLLGALHANRVGTTNFNLTKEYVEVASKMELSQAYPIYSWIIENMNRKYSNTDNAYTFIRPIFDYTLLGAKFSLAISGENKMKFEKLTSQFSNVNRSSFIVKPGERDQAIQYLKNWFDNHATEYLKICDPYFGPNDLELIQIFRTLNPDINFEILTSQKQQLQEGLGYNFEEEYLNYWRLNISDQDPPTTTIVIVGTKKKQELPIHDRWMVSKGSGLRMGTSLNSLGDSKESELSVLNEDEIILREAEMDKYLTCKKREHEGERIHYSVVPL